MSLREAFVSQRNTWKRWLLLVLALGLLQAAPATSAQAPVNAPTLTLHLPWEGTVRMPGWTEVQVVLAATDTAWQGELVLTDRQQQLTYQQHINLPASGRQSLRLPLYVAEPGIFTLELLAPNGAAVIAHRLPLRSAPTKARFCVAVDTLKQLAPRTENGCDSSLLLANLETLPETAMAWDAIDVLILREVSTTALTPAQREALWAWVILGGQLTIVEGPGTAQTLAGLPPSLKEAARQLSAGMIRTVGTGELARVRQDTAVGAATTSWLGDWRARRVPAVSLLPAEISLNAIMPTGDALMQVPRSQVPQLSFWLILLLPLYAAMIGPGAWWLAQRLQRPQLAWAFIPGGILLTALTIWLGITGAITGTFPLTHEIAVVYGSQSDAPARVLQTTAIFAPRARSLAWNTELAPRPFLGYADTATSMTAFYESRPFPAQVFWERTGGKIAVANPPGPLTWASEGLMSLPQIEMATTMLQQSGRTLLSGSLSSEIALQEVTLIFEDGAHRILIAQTVAAGTPLEVTVPLEQMQSFEVAYTPLCSNLGGGNYYPYIATPLGIAPTTAKSFEHCYLTASTEGVPFPSQDPSVRRIEETCLILSVPCPELEGGGIPLFPQLDFESAGYGWMGGNGEINISDGAPVILLYTPLRALPEDVALTQARVILHLEVIEPLPQFSLEVWDWETAQWLLQTSPNISAPLVLEGDLVRAVVNPTTGMRVRISLHDSDFGTLNLNAILEITPTP